MGKSFDSYANTVQVTDNKGETQLIHGVKDKYQVRFGISQLENLNQQDSLKWLIAGLKDMLSAKFSISDFLVVNDLIKEKREDILLYSSEGEIYGMFLSGFNLISFKQVEPIKKLERELASKRPSDIRLGYLDTLINKYPDYFFLENFKDYIVFAKEQALADSSLLGNYYVISRLYGYRDSVHINISKSNNHLVYSSSLREGEDYLFASSANSFYFLNCYDCRGTYHDEEDEFTIELAYPLQNTSREWRKLRRLSN